MHGSLANAAFNQELAGHGAEPKLSTATAAPVPVASSDPSTSRLTPPGKAAPLGSYAVSIIATVEGFVALAPELEGLPPVSIEQNVFYEGWMLRTALAWLPITDVRIAVVRHQSDGIVGFFPFELVRRFQGLPIRALRLWRYPYCFLCTPLIHKEHGRQTVDALLNWVESDASPAHLLDLDLVTTAAPFADLLAQDIARRTTWVEYTRTYDRACFLPAENSRAGLSTKHRKEARRLERRLADMGTIHYRAAESGEPIEPWLDSFLRLEAGGWKGRAGTALASAPQTRQFFWDIATEAASRHQLHMLALELDGVPIAMKCNLLAKDGGFAFKIAFDERFSRYSPGTLLELFNMRHLVESRPDLRWIDSCADREHHMINRLWAGRRAMGTIWLASGGIAAAILRCWPHYHRLSRFVRGLRHRAA